MKDNDCISIDRCEDNLQSILSFSMKIKMEKDDSDKIGNLFEHIRYFFEIFIFFLVRILKENKEISSNLCTMHYRIWIWNIECLGLNISVFLFSETPIQKKSKMNLKN